MKRLMLAFLLLILALATGVGIYQVLQPPHLIGSQIDPPAEMGTFTLRSDRGAVSLDSFRGRYVILYFGYTSCPDVCPTTLANLKTALERLKAEEASQFQVIFLSVDPARDTPQISSAYARRFHPSFLGLTGTPEEMQKTANQFGIFFQVNPPDDETGFYTVDHSSFTLVLNRQGALRLTWPYGLQSDDFLNDMQALLKME